MILRSDDSVGGRKNVVDSSLSARARGPKHVFCANSNVKFIYEYHFQALVIPS